MYERTKKRKNKRRNEQTKANKRMSKRTNQGTNKSLFSAAEMISKRLEDACAMSKKQRQIACVKREFRLKPLRHYKISQLQCR